MIRKLPALAAMLLGIGIAWQTAGAEGLIRHARPACEPGFKIVEETVYHDVVRTVCKMVPETKTKWVYSSVIDPLCIQETKHGQCTGCTPFYRRVLVKTKIEEPCPTMKCVSETIVERVPVIVYKKVPCGPTAVGPTAVEEIPVKPLPKK